MTLKSYLWGMRIAALLSFVALGIVVSFIDPDMSGPVGFLLFYGSLFFCSAGIWILFLTSIRRRLGAEELALAELGMSFRQGILLSVLLVILLVLQSQRMLVWWVGLLVTAGIFLTELYFLSRK